MNVYTRNHNSSEHRLTSSKLAVEMKAAEILSRGKIEASLRLLNNVRIYTIMPFVLFDDASRLARYTLTRRPDVRPFLMSLNRQISPAEVEKLRSSIRALHH